MEKLTKVSSILIMIFGLLLLPQFLEAESEKGNPELVKLVNLININSADKKGLVSLPGIGKTKADDIIKYRTEHGNFAKKEELRKVKGIGAKTFEDIKDLITLSDDEIAKTKQ